MKKIGSIWSLALLMVWMLPPAVRAETTDNFKVRVDEDRVRLQIEDNGKPVAEVDPRFFYDGWKHGDFLTPEEDSPYDGIAVLPGNKSVGVKVSYEFLKDGVHVRYVMTPLDDMMVYRVQGEVDYDYDTWIGGAYQLGQQTGTVSSDKPKGTSTIAEGDARLLNLGPTQDKDMMGLTSSVQTVGGLHTTLQDARQWWPKLTASFTHGEKSDKLWNWKKGEPKVIDFTLKFNRGVILVKKNEPKDVDALKPQIDELINPIIQGKWVPCMVVGVLYKGQARVFGYGVTDMENGHQPDGDTVFGVGSITKLFSKLLLSDMVQRGQMKLDDPVQNYVPSGVKLPTKGGKEMTLVQLAEHMSGLDFRPTDMDFEKDPDAFSHYSLTHLYGYLSGYNMPSIPGDVYQYSNTGMALLGTVLALKNGTTYEEYIQKRILNPLGMTDSGITWTPAQTAQAATPYYLDNVKTVKGEWTERAFDGSVALHSSANDLLKLAQAVMSPDNPVLGNIAFGDTAKRVDWGGKTVQHGGDIYGFNSSFYLDRKKKLALIVLANNGSTIAASKVAEKIGYVLHGIEADPVDYPKLVEVPKSQLKPYVGRYLDEETTDSAYLNKYYDVTIVKGHLLSTGENSIEARGIYQTKNKGFYVKSGAYQLEFLKDSTGRVIGARPTGENYFAYLFRKLGSDNQPLCDPAWPKGKPLMDSTSLLIDDFESGAVTNKLGGAWRVDVDDRHLGTILKDGKDFMVKNGATGSRGCARIYGHFGRSVSPWPYVTLYTSLNPQEDTVDMSGYKAVEFWVKGDGKKYSFSVETTPVLDYAYFQSVFTAPPQWTKVHIDLNSLVQPAWGKEIFRDFGSVKHLRFGPTGMSDEDFDLSVDDVTLLKYGRGSNRLP